MTLQVEGLGWHGPDHASRGAPVVGAPNRSCDYGVVAPPRAWDRGIPQRGPLYFFNSLLGMESARDGVGSAK